MQRVLLVLLVGISLLDTQSVGTAFTSGLWTAIQAKIVTLPESGIVQTLAASGWGEIFTRTQDPFLWLAGLFAKATGVTPPASLLLVGNLFFVFFLWELHTLLSRYVVPEVATQATLLAALWPTSYELSLGSAFVLTCWLVLRVVRHCIDGQWLLCGIFHGVLVLMDTFAFALVPLNLYVFWFFARHLEKTAMLRNALFLFGPVVGAMWWRYGGIAPVPSMIGGSALSHLAGSFTHGGYLGQTIAIAFLATGAVFGAIANDMLMHKLIPIVVVLGVLAFSPYTNIASRGLLAALALQGIALRFPYGALKVTRFVFIVLAALDVWAVFN